jgi:hypothetical protein
MPALDLRILIVTPFALAEVFLLWALWSFIRESIVKKSRGASRVVSLPQNVAPAAARVFNFPESGSAAPIARSSNKDTGPRHQPSGSGSQLPQRLAGLPTR